MAGAINVVLGCLNLLASVAALSLLSIGAWVSGKADNPCERGLLQIPAYAPGGALLLLSIVGFFGACFRVKRFLVLYLIAVSVFVVVYAGLAGFVVVRSYKGDDVREYSSWVPNWVYKQSTWRIIQSCLVRAEVCGDLQNHNYSEAHFYLLQLSSLQSGCCTPPHHCNFKYKNATVWTGSSHNEDKDCQTWSNVQTELCYGCQSCKIGVLHEMGSKWKAIAIANALVLIILILVCSLACCALYNDRHRRQLSQK